jgi:hypothetical protein
MNDAAEKESKISPETRAVIKKMAAALWTMDNPNKEDRSAEEFRKVSKEYSQKARKLMKRMQTRGLDVVLSENAPEEDGSAEG